MTISKHTQDLCNKAAAVAALVVAAAAVAAGSKR